MLSPPHFQTRVHDVRVISRWCPAQPTVQCRLRSPETEEPVQHQEDEQTEEQHVAQQFALAPSGQLLHSANGGAQEPARRVEVRVHFIQHFVMVFDFCSYVNRHTPDGADFSPEPLLQLLVFLLIHTVPTGDIRPWASIT